MIVDIFIIFGVGFMAGVALSALFSAILGEIQLRKALKELNKGQKSKKKGGK